MRDSLESSSSAFTLFCPDRPFSLSRLTRFVSSPSFSSIISLLCLHRSFLPSLSSLSYSSRLSSSSPHFSRSSSSWPHPLFRHFRLFSLTLSSLPIPLESPSSSLLSTLLLSGHDSRPFPFLLSLLLTSSVVPSSRHLSIIIISASPSTPTRPFSCLLSPVVSPRVLCSGGCFSLRSSFSGPLPPFISDVYPFSVSLTLSSLPVYSIILIYAHPLSRAVSPLFSSTLLLRLLPSFFSKIIIISAPPSFPTFPFYVSSLSLSVDLLSTWRSLVNLSFISASPSYRLPRYLCSFSPLSLVAALLVTLPQFSHSSHHLCLTLFRPDPLHFSGGVLFAFFILSSIYLRPTHPTFFAPRGNVFKKCLFSRSSSSLPYPLSDCPFLSLSLSLSRLSPVLSIIIISASPSFRVLSLSPLCRLSPVLSIIIISASPSFRFSFIYFRSLFNAFPICSPHPQPRNPSFISSSSPNSILAHLSPTPHALTVFYLVLPSPNSYLSPSLPPTRPSPPHTVFLSSSFFRQLQSSISPPPPPHTSCHNLPHPHPHPYRLYLFSSPIHLPISPPPPPLPSISSSSPQFSLPYLPPTPNPYR
ncbi:hypothetical protein C7M84_004711 [Penaeus vannamei]|uniref:Uncharacterized protein n=1 Tax=Penaeus vannamei TaxID=6689 RepID=A0A3R7N3Z2_PENVA|nr:hypothetical protein C7M84_004711 [Penaeus vannamei]